MSIRNHIPIAAIAATLAACHPAHADVLLNPASVPLDPARPGWRPPHRNPGIPAGAGPAGGNSGGHADAAPDSGEPSAFDTFGRWQGTPPSPLPRPVAPPVVKCRPVSTVPGPLPVLGVAATWGWARRLRRRLRGAGELLRILRPLASATAVAFVSTVGAAAVAIVLTQPK